MITKLYKDIKRKHYWKEYKESLGSKNKDITFYVIRRTGGMVGLCSYVNVILGHLAYAKEKGYVPIVDMQYYPNTYLEKENLGSQNSWEYFYRQTSAYNLEEVFQSKNVIFSGGGLAPKYIMGDEKFYSNGDGELDFWRDIYNEYIQFSEQSSQYIEKICSQYLGNGKTLGVICRGTDYIEKRPSGHAVQPTTKQIIEKIHEVLDECNCNTIFVATEDANIYEHIKEEFGDIVVTNQTEFVNYTGNWINDDLVAQKKDIKEMGMNYLAAMVVISRCECIIASECNGAATAAIMSNGHQYEHYWNLGVY